MTLLSTKTVFPGGWRYKQFDKTGRLLKEFKSMSPWSMFLQEITEFRKKNALPRATLDEVDADAQEYICALVGNDLRLCCCEEGSKKNFLSRVRAGVGRAVGVARRLADGAAILSEWVGDGLAPVSKTEAQDRADVCTGRGGAARCPHNRADATLADFTGPIAAIVHRQMNHKAGLQLFVDGEPELTTCGVCLCDLKLKVWCPSATILSRTPNAMWRKFAAESPPNCWMRALNPNMP